MKQPQELKSLGLFFVSKKPNFAVDGKTHSTSNF